MLIGQSVKWKGRGRNSKHVCTHHLGRLITSKSAEGLLKAGPAGEFRLIAGSTAQVYCYLYYNVRIYMFFFESTKALHYNAQEENRQWSVRRTES